MKGDHLETVKIFFKKLKNERFEQSDSAKKCKKGTFCDFSISIQLQNIKKEGDLLETFKMFQSLKKGEGKVS